MAKIAVISDSHFGMKSDSGPFKTYIGKFFSEIFFPYLDKNPEIREIIHLGDLFDKRKGISYETLKFVQDVFLDEIEKRKLNLYIAVGNHDIVHNNTSDVCSCRLLLSRYPNIKSYLYPQDVQIGEDTFSFIPWLNEQTIANLSAYLQNTKSEYCFGHLEVSGYEVFRGVKSDEGIDRKILSQYKKVFTGHFHQKHEYGNICYLGTQYDMTSADIEEVKGFHVFDSSDGSMQFIENPHKMFFRLVYDDSIPGNMNKFPDFSPYKDKFVRLLVKGKKHPVWFDKYLGQLYDVTPAEVKIMEEIDLNHTADPGEVDVTQGTMQIIHQEIDGNSEIEDKDRIKKIMNELYQASQLETTPIGIAGDDGKC